MVKKILVLLWLITFLSFTACEDKKPLADKNLDMLIQASTYIFAGTFEKLGSAYISSVPANDNTSVIKVEYVYTPADILGDLTGKQVTVQLKETQTISSGTRAIFLQTAGFTVEV